MGVVAAVERKIQEFCLFKFARPVDLQRLMSSRQLEKLLIRDG